MKNTLGRSITHIFKYERRLFIYRSVELTADVRVNHFGGKKQTRSVITIHPPHIAHTTCHCCMLYYDMGLLTPVLQQAGCERSALLSLGCALSEGQYTSYHCRREYNPKLKLWCASRAPNNGEYIYVQSVQNELSQRYEPAKKKKRTRGETLVICTIIPEL